MAKERLVGSDGKLVTVTYDDEVAGVVGGDDLDELAGGTSGDGAGSGWYEITAIGATSTVFDTDLQVGDLFWDDGSLVLDYTGASDLDKAKKLIETEQADVTSFNLEVSKAEIDVTTLADGVRRYRTGKIDMTGSMEGITTLGETDSAGWVINNFMKVVSQSSAGATSVTVTEVDDSPIYIKGVLQKDTSGGEKEAFFWAKINLLGSSLGASGEDAQSFSSSFRIAPGDPEPTYYVREVAAV
jgi:hypothetical protein